MITKFHPELKGDNFDKNLNFFNETDVSPI